MDIAKFLRIVFLYNTSGGCFWQSYHGTVKSAGVPVLWFRASTCFWFWSKTFTKSCSNNFYYNLTKQFLPRLIWLVTCIRFQNMFWKNINCFRFQWKTHTKRCINNYVISRVKRFSFLAIGQGMISGYNLENRTWRWKYRFWFCSASLYFADLKTIYFASCLCCSCKLF